MNLVEHIEGQTFHGRRGGPDNAFRYSVDFVVLNPAEEPIAPWLFSRNKRNIFSLWDRDHGGAPKEGRGVPWVHDVLKTHNLKAFGSKVLLIAQPRVLGHVFNPVSFWLCYDAHMKLGAVIAEVSNTFGDRHSYLCVKDDLSPISREDTVTAAKIFHVSPFQPVEGNYQFRFDIDDDKIGIWIDYTAGSGGLLATLTGKRSPLTTASAFRALLRRPLGSRRVLGLIHWQALKLWWKGAGYRPRPTPPSREVS